MTDNGQPDYSVYATKKYVRQYLGEIACAAKKRFRLKISKNEQQKCVA